MASGDHGQRRRTRKTQRGWRGKKNRRWKIKEKQTQRQREGEAAGEKKITNREEWSEKGKTFVTLSCRTIG